MTLEEAKNELEKFVKLKTSLRPAFLDVILKAEPSEEQVKEYCRKRNFVVITKELYYYLQYRWANNNDDVGILSAEQNWNGDPIKR